MSKFCAGIVTYQPDLPRLVENIRSTVNQVDKIYIVDNASENINEIYQLVKSFTNIVIIENNDNYGIAKALNQMCEKAITDGFAWILTLDQDTVIPHDLIKQFVEHVNANENGIICPAVYYEGWEKERKGRTDTDYVSACMTSASFTRLEAWLTVGGFREDYFIDHVDNEFCMKLKIHGYKILRVNSCIINHRIGKAEKRKILGLFTVYYSQHSPLRQYYMTRNNYIFINEYGSYLPTFKEKVKLFYLIIMAILFSDNRKQTFNYILKGIYDAKNKIMGKYDLEN